MFKYSSRKSVGLLRYIIKKSGRNILMFSAVTHTAEQRNQLVRHLTVLRGGKLVLLAANLQDDNHITM